MAHIELTVDGDQVSDDVEPRMFLVQYLREKLGKTGTVIGCDTSNGWCLHGAPRRPEREAPATCSRYRPAASEVTTIEGVAQQQTASCTRCRRRSTSVTASSAASVRRG